MEKRPYLQAVGSGDDPEAGPSHLVYDTDVEGLRRALTRAQQDSWNGVSNYEISERLGTAIIAFLAAVEKES